MPLFAKALRCAIRVLAADTGDVGMTCPLSSSRAPPGGGTSVPITNNSSSGADAASKQLTARLAARSAAVSLSISSGSPAQPSEQSRWILLMPART